ncbi:hypothetical protein E4U32_007854, partial [Claviceps aff. humidiphila group G2b]
MAHSVMWSLLQGAERCPYCRELNPEYDGGQETRSQPQQSSQVTAASLPRHQTSINLEQSRQQPSRTIPESYPPRHQGRLNNLSQAQVLPTAPLTNQRERLEDYKQVTKNLQRRAKEAGRQTRGKRETETDADAEAEALPSPWRLDTEGHSRVFLLVNAALEQCVIRGEIETLGKSPYRLGEVEIALTDPFEWPSNTVDWWIDHHVRPHYKTVGYDTQYAIGARRDAKGALRKLPGWKYPDLRDISELFDERNKYDFEVKHGRLLVQVSFYTFEEQAVATPRSGRRDRRKRRPTVGFEDEDEGAERMTPSHLSRKRSAADQD